MIGGLLLGFIEIMSVAFLPSLSGYRDAFAFIVLVLVLLVKPTGLVRPAVGGKDMNASLRNLILNLLAIAALGAFLLWAEGNLDGYKIQILNLIAVNAILALSLNLIYGFTGMFSLGMPDSWPSEPMFPLYVSSLRIRRK